MIRIPLQRSYLYAVMRIHNAWHEHGDCAVFGFDRGSI